MPLARIDLAEGKSTDYRRTIGEVVYDALVEVLKALKDVASRSSWSIQSKMLSLILTSWAFRDGETAFFIQVTLNAGRAWIRNVPFTKQSQTDCTSVSACSGETRSFVWSKSAKRTGRWQR
jgi:hypothetical protein